jgi:hypothetical protein
MKADEQPIRLDDLDAAHPLRQVPFTAPPGYFDSLPGRIQAGAMAQRAVVTDPRPAFRIGWSWQRTAVSLAGLSVVAVLIWQTLPQRQESLGAGALAGVSTEAIAAYLDEQGVNPAELTDPTLMQQSLGADSTTIQFLNVNPAEIRQHIDHQALPQKTDQGS